MVFPAKPSHTITLTSPFVISLGSMFPIKFSFSSDKSLNVSFVRSFPFSASSPIFTSPTEGFSPFKTPL